MPDGFFLPIITRMGQHTAAARADSSLVTGLRTHTQPDARPDGLPPHRVLAGASFGLAVSQREDDLATS